MGINDRSEVVVSFNHRGRNVELAIPPWRVIEDDVLDPLFLNLHGLPIQKQGLSL